MTNNNRKRIVDPTVDPQLAAIETLMTRQAGYFNKILLFLIIGMAVIMVVVIGLTYNMFQLTGSVVNLAQSVSMNSKSIVTLDNFVKDTLADYKPNTAAQNKSRSIIADNNHLNKEQLEGITWGLNNQTLIKKNQNNIMEELKEIKTLINSITNH